MIPNSKTLVLITIDAEPSASYENGCFSYCVIGRWPDRLQDWYELQIAEPTKKGYKFKKSFKAGLIQYQGKERRDGPVLTRDEVAKRISNATAGLPSILI